jgi:hypothetical protein
MIAIASFSMLKSDTLRFRTLLCIKKGEFVREWRVGDIDD